jgi:hypothetical protein
MREQKMRKKNRKRERNRGENKIMKRRARRK